MTNKPAWLHRFLSVSSSKRIYQESFPREIRIETINSCNSSCSFCPMGVNSEATKNRQVKRMDDALFRKIIDEMASVSYSGIVKFYCNNEALLDRRIVEFIEYTKERHFYKNPCSEKTKRISTSWFRTDFCYKSLFNT